MLLRAYRVTDKLGLVLLKFSTLVVEWMLDSMQALRRGGLSLGGGLFGVLWGLLRGLFVRLRRLLALILGVIGTVVLTLFGWLRQGVDTGGRIASRTSRRATASASGAASTAMARRAARAEIDSTVVEDPLRAQNRVLSGLVVVVLGLLVVVVIWATSGGTGGASVPLATGADLSAGLNVLTPQATAAGAAIPAGDGGAAQFGAGLSTPVPTATQLPQVLAVRGSLAFVARERGQDDIWVASVDGGRPIRVTSSAADDRDPAWSPDGTQIAYASRRDGNWDLYVMNVADPAAEPFRLTFGLEFQAAPVWSPDGLFIAYESYQGENLDIYVVAVDGSQPPQRLPEMSDGPDFAPAWSPVGRQIAYVSWRDGSQDIFVFDLDTQQTRNLTATPERHEDYPAWSPDGDLLAYSAVDAGIEKVFVRGVDTGAGPAEVLRQGRAPDWSPDGAAIVYAVDSIDGTQFIVAPYGGSGVTTGVTAINLPGSDPTWTQTALPAALVNAGGVPLGVEQPLFDEAVVERVSDPPYILGDLPGVRGAPLPSLSDRVNDSFIALREAVLEQAGRDFLGTLEDALWSLDRRPQPGEPNENWHRTGRAFAYNRNLILGGFPPEVVVVREDTDLETYWRVFLRVDDDNQSGQLGEPLRRMPWVFPNINDGDVEAYDRGGRLQGSVPVGYYVDLTRLAADYGWQRMPAGSDWRANAFSRNYWLFYKPDGLGWCEAMRELYTQAQLGGWCQGDEAVTVPSAGGEGEG